MLSRLFGRFGGNDNDGGGDGGGSAFLRLNDHRVSGIF